MATGPTLYEFLLEAELAQYFNSLKSDLKVSNVAQLKYVEEDDLAQLGMTKPEQRRLRKFFQKYCPQTYLRKIKNIIKTKNKDSDRPLTFLSEYTDDKLTVKVPSKHIIPFENIVLNKQLGIGEFGVVQQGVWTNEDGERIQVAIKCLNEDRMQKNHMEFLKEAAIMHTVDNKNIVRLYGVVLETNALMLVTELAPLRSLLECLKEPALRQSFPVITLCDFAFQICDGMQYLENKKLIHRDLAARNILVFAKNIVKISDFGLSRALGVGKDYYQTNFNVNLKLPIAWCAPECINYLRFTSSSDVWAYGVTLWEMFSYGFNPWAALTGQQILEAIDEPNYQRLEQPECCPKEYYMLMKYKCWQHEANKRPKFSEILLLLPECKPEQVQTVQDFDVPANSKPKKDYLLYHTGDIITVLDKRPPSENGNLWKGITNSGKTGLFNPADTVAYLGQNLPTTRPSFSRVDGKSGIYASKRRLCSDMISRPQGDFKHTGHVGLDGAFFGDISFLGDKYHQLPKQIVTPYKPQDDKENVSPTLTTSSDASDKTPLLINMAATSSGKSGPAADAWSEEFLEKTSSSSYCSQMHDKSKKSYESTKTLLSPDHEYHEISDNDDDGFGLIENGKFEALDFGPSLMDEVLMALGTKSSAETTERKSNDTLHKTDNKENATLKLSKENSKKKHAVVKPISAADQQTLDSAIAMAKELASKSMLNLDYTSENDTPVDSPKTPNSPVKRKFSFKFKTSPKSERRNFSEETEAISDIHEAISEEAKEVYDSLVQKGETAAAVTPSPTLMLQPVPISARNRGLSSGYVPAEPVIDTEVADTNPLRMLRSAVPVKPKFRGNRHGIPGSGRAATPHTATVARIAANAGMSSINGLRSPPGMPPPPPPPNKNAAKERTSSENTNSDAKVEDQSDASSTNTNVSSIDSPDSLSNPLPLPPRDRTKPLPTLKHHQRKHPLLIPNVSDSRNLTKQVSCPDVPSHSVSPPSSQAERRSSEGGGSLVSIESKPISPATSLTSSLSCSSFSASSNPPPKPARTYNLDESLELQIQAEIDNLDNETDAQAMYKGGDHVSCEDLLEFALDRPNARRTQGRSRGVDSDEVRIMQKVLASENSTPEECMDALNETDWNVHKAIKYLKLQGIVKAHLIPADSSKAALATCNWDVSQAANCLLATYNVTEDTTEV